MGSHFINYVEITLVFDSGIKVKITIERSAFDSTTIVWISFM